MLHNLLARKFSQQTVSKNLTKLLINGKFEDSVSGKTFENFNPSTEEKIGDIQSAGTADVDKAVLAARNEFENGPWRRMSGYERGQRLYRLSELMDQNTEEIARLETLDNGKPLTHATHMDVPFSAKIFRYYAGWADKIHGKVVPHSGGNFFHYTREEPVGVVGAIIPWNFPQVMQAMKMAPALAAGCPIVLKTAELTPLSAMKVGELALEAGIPEGAIHIISGLGAEAGQHLAQHQEVDKIAFTGSTKVGYDIMRNSHKHNLKRITLELGGKSAHVICDDADVDFAVQNAMLGCFINAGQCCFAGTRIFVQEGIYDQFVAKAVEAAKATKVGDPFDVATGQGPQISNAQLQKIMGYIESGKQQANLAVGGNRIGTKGHFIEPTIFTDVQDDTKIAQEEIFGPVMSVLKFKTIDEVIQRTNNSSYGLAAGIVTKSQENTFKFVNGVRAGTVFVNAYASLDKGPFGGFKDSGIGREMGEAGLKNYLETKTVIQAMPADALP